MMVVVVVIVSVIVGSCLSVIRVLRVWLVRVGYGGCVWHKTVVL